MVDQLLNVRINFCESPTVLSVKLVMLGWFWRKIATASGGTESQPAISKVSIRLGRRKSLKHLTLAEVLGDRKSFSELLYLRSILSFSRLMMWTGSTFWIDVEHSVATLDDQFFLVFLDLTNDVVEVEVEARIWDLTSHQQQNMLGELAPALENLRVWWWCHCPIEK